MSGDASNKSVLAISRRALLTGYAIAVVTLLLAEACQFITESTAFRTPLPRPDRLPYAIVFTVVIAVGLLADTARWPKRVPLAGPLLACLTAAYVLALLVVTAIAAWTDFTATDPAFGLNGWTRLQAFFEKHPPFDLGIGFWVFVSPVALLTFPAVLCFMGFRLDRKDITERLAGLILSIGVASAAFLLGSMMTETRFPRDLIDVGDLVFAATPVIVLGALTAWVAVKFSARPLRRAYPAQADAAKSISSASQISVLTLVLLYLGISQTSGYANRTADLIELRHAFASDILHDFVASGADLAAFTLDANGKPAESWNLVPDVPWGDVKIVKFASEPIAHRFNVQTTESITGESWNIDEYGQTFGGTRTQQIADRQGVRYEASDGAIKLYPRIETQLRAKEVAFPGAGISFELASFTLVVPFVVFASLVLLAYRANTAVANYSAVRDPWLLLDADRGLPGFLAWLWIGALALGPWVLGVLMVQAVGLTLRAKGPLNSLLLEGVATAYVALVLAILVAATASALKAVLMLRALARENAGAAV